MSASFNGKIDSKSSQARSSTLVTPVADSSSLNGRVVTRNTELLDAESFFAFAAGWLLYVAGLSYDGKSASTFNYSALVLGGMGLAGLTVSYILNPKGNFPRDQSKV